VGSIGPDPRGCEPNVIVIVDDISLYPSELYENGMAIITAERIRNHPAALNPRIKSLNYLNNILGKWEAIRAGCFEALMLNYKGEVAECTGDNVFIVKNGALKTPPLDACLLAGVTRAAVIELAGAAGISVSETPLLKQDVLSADEVFLTGTAAEIIPVVKCDNQMIGTGKPGPITRQLRERFQKLVRT